MNLMEKEERESLNEIFMKYFNRIVHIYDKKSMYVRISRHAPSFFGTRFSDQSNQHLFCKISKESSPVS